MAINQTNSANRQIAVTHVIKSGVIKHMYYIVIINVMYCLAIITKLAALLRFHLMMRTWQGSLTELFQRDYTPHSPSLHIQVGLWSQVH